jgi:molecular chaperone GrpE (heat shock protein)
MNQHVYYSLLYALGRGPLPPALAALRESFLEETGRPFATPDDVTLLWMAAERFRARSVEPASHARLGFTSAEPIGPEIRTECRFRKGASREGAAPSEPFVPQGAARQELRPPTSGTDSEAAESAERESLIKDLTAQLAETKRQFDERAVTLGAREAELKAAREQADRVAAEAEAVRREDLRQQGRFFIGGIIQARDQLERVGNDPRVTADQVVKHVLKLTAQLLQEHGVTVLRAEEGPLDPDSQQVVGSVSTTEPALELTIQSTVRSGYRQGAALIRPQQVLVWRSGQPDGGA